MICVGQNPAARRYVIRMEVAAEFCILFALVSTLVFRHLHPAGTPAYLVAILPALPIVGAIVGTGLYLDEERDEFQRNLLVQSLLGALVER
jgi:hypothetical protein